MCARPKRQQIHKTQKLVMLVGLLLEWVILQSSVIGPITPPCHITWRGKSDWVVSRTQSRRFERVKLLEMPLVSFPATHHKSLLFSSSIHVVRPVKEVMLFVSFLMNKMGVVIRRGFWYVATSFSFCKNTKRLPSHVTPSR